MYWYILESLFKYKCDVANNKKLENNNRFQLYMRIENLLNYNGNCKKFCQ